MIYEINTEQWSIRLIGIGIVSAIVIANILFFQWAWGITIWWHFITVMLLWLCLGTWSSGIGIAIGGYLIFGD